MTRKKDPNIIRVGDLVKVMNPRVFERCGYPMSFEDAVKEVENKYGDKIKEFIYSIEDEARTYVMGFTLDRNEITNNDPTFNKIVRALAYNYLGRKKFGGRERKIYTKEVGHLLHRLVVVCKVRFVKTGFYMPGGGPYYSYEDPYPEYDQAYLDKEKTHKILSVSSVTNGQYDDWKHGRPVSDIGWWEFDIEADNVKKLFPNKEGD